MKNIVVFAFPSWARFPIKLICCIALGHYQVLAVYLNRMLSFYSIYKNNCNLLDS